LAAPGALRPFVGGCSGSDIDVRGAIDSISKTASSLGEAALSIEGCFIAGSISQQKSGTHGCMVLHGLISDRIESFP